MVDALITRLDKFYREELRLEGPVPLHAPSFGRRESDYVSECIETGWVSSVGAFVNRFEAEVAKVCGCRYGIATVNGTAALHLALHALGVGAGDLVLCPALTFVATANAIAATGAAPLFLDSDSETLGVSPARLADFLSWETETQAGTCVHRASGRRIAALVPVHIFGHPVDFDPLAGLAAERGMPVIEDAAEALGSRYRSRPCGSLGCVAAISFNGNKPVTTGGGGMLVTDDEDLARRLKHLSTTARVSHAWDFDHDEPGFNYRMPNLNAALGCAQMERFGECLAAKRRLAERYGTLLDGLGDVRLFREQSWAESNYWLNALLLPDRRARDRFLEQSNRRGIQSRPCWRLLPQTGAWRNAIVAGDLAGAQWIADHLVNIPSSPSLMMP
ncbi:MAG: LegC family aminotransferase [Rhodospirillaceae bacterium]